MNELMTKSLAQIVNSNYRAASLFEKYHLDFCCKGKRSLQKACEESNINADELVAELESALSGPGNLTADFNNLTLTELSDYIVETHHTYVKKELPILLGYLQKVAAKHGDRHPELFKIFELFAAIKEEMELHMKKEEEILFPRIKEIEKQIKEGTDMHINITYLQAPINMMEQEHDHAGSLTAEIRKLTSNYTPPVDACTTYRLSFASLQAFELNLHQHVHLENNVLFPKAIKILGKKESFSLI